MNSKITNGINSVKSYITKHSPEILTGIGVCGMITSTVLAVKATPKALELIADAEKEKYKNALAIDKDGVYRRLDWKEIVQATWKLYIPSLGIGVSSIACLIGACAVNSKRNAALATAYTISDKAFRTYRDKVIETIGEKKEKNLRDQISQERVNQDTEQTRQVIITPKGQTLCLDELSGRYFRSDLDTIRKAVNELNRSMTYHNYISLNEYYYAIGLDQVKYGDNIGWNIDSGLIELDFGACITDTDEPCIVINYDVCPKEGYDR